MSMTRKDATPLAQRRSPPHAPPVTRPRGPTPLCYKTFSLTEAESNLSHGAAACAAPCPAANGATWRCVAWRGGAWRGELGYGIKLPLYTSRITQHPAPCHEKFSAKRRDERSRRHTRCWKKVQQIVLSCIVNYFFPKRL